MSPNYTRRDYVSRCLQSTVDQLMTCEEAQKRLALREAAADYAVIYAALDRMIS